MEMDVEIGHSGVLKKHFSWLETFHSLLYAKKWM